MNILIIDPDEFFVDRLLSQLIHAGITAEYMKTGHAGWFLWERNHSRYDLVMMEMGLLGISGLGLTKLIRHDHPTIPILIVSTRHEEKSLVMKLGATAFLTKPIGATIIIEKIKNLTSHGRKSEGTGDKGQ